MLMEMPAAS